MTIKARFPLLLLLLGVLFLASVCVSYGIAQGNPCHQKCLQRCKRMNVASKRHECRERCGESSKEKSCEGEEEEEEEEEEERPPRHWEPERRERGRRERGRQEGEKEEEERDGGGRVRDRKERSRRLRHGESESESHGRNNPYLFRSNRFETIFENDHGYIRLLQRFDKRSKLLENLQNYRIVEYKSKPHTLFLPHHIDADFILVVLSGKAILTVVNTNDRDTYNLERGDAIRLPAGTIAYLANRDDQEDLRVVDLVIPINRPGRFNSFVAASSPKSYFNGFSKNFLEAAFNSDFEEIERVLLGEQEQEQQQRHRGGSQQGDAIVKVSREQIEQISRHAKSSSRKSVSSESEPFNLRSRSPIYSNKFGKFYEITPEKSPQLQDLDVFLSCAEIKEGAIMLPHYNSRAIIIGVVNEGKGELELVGLRNPQQEQEEEEEEEEEESSSPEVHRYRARLSPGDVFVIPSSHPVAVNASSDLYLLGFGINAENNQRNFLAGEEENVISQIQRPVKEVAFPGSAQVVERLFKNQRQSYFADGQPQQREEGSQRRRGPLSSILGAFY